MAGDEIRRRHRERSEMGVVIFVLLTLAAFAVLHVVQKLVEGL